jgi:hypothetical protein
MNIVFDKWDKNSNPIPNFNYLNEKVVCDAITYPVFLNDLYLDTPIKHYKVEDMNKNENFYYIIQHMYSYQHFLKNGIVNFSNEIKNAITNKNLKVMFVSPHESPEYLEMFIVILNKMIVDNNWDENQFYIINNNSLIYKIKEKLNSNINFYKINSLIKFPSIDITIKPKIYMRNEINIVFDKWDENDTPIQNLQELDDKNGKYTIIYPYFLQELDIKYCKINKCKLSDIKPDKNFYYIIGQTHTYSMFHDNEKIYLPAEVEYHITNNNLKVIYLADHESPPDLNPFVNVLSNHIKKNNWKESNFYIMSNNSMLYDLKDKLNSGINFYKTNTLLKLVSNDLKVKPAEIDIMYDKKFIFLCQNRQPHFHRVAFLTQLKNINLLENDIIDWSLVIDYNTYNNNINQIKSIKHLEGYVDIKNNKLIKDYVSITKNKKLSYYETGVDWFDKVEDYTQIQHLTIDSYKNSYINIVTESKFNFTENDIHITEKTFKPFYYFQIPIFLAAYNHVKMLRKEYDFYLFDDLIDHSYDNEINDIKRFHMVIDEIKRLSNMREEINIYYKNNINKIICNHNFVKNYPKKKIDEKYFVKL